MTKYVVKRDVYKRQPPYSWMHIELLYKSGQESRHFLHYFSHYAAMEVTF